LLQRCCSLLRPPMPTVVVAGPSTKKKRLELLKNKLGLTADQVQQIEAIHSAARAKTKAQRQQVRPLRRQMRQLMTAETFDAAKVYALYTQIQSLRQMIKEERFKAKLQLMQLLTKDQRSTLQTLRKQRWKRRFKRSQRLTGGAPSAS
jgi:Spy/CpxP family protein refolding chaperone